MSIRGAVRRRSVALVLVFTSFRAYPYLTYPIRILFAVDPNHRYNVYSLHGLMQRRDPTVQVEERGGGWGGVLLQCVSHAGDNEHTEKSDVDH